MSKPAKLKAPFPWFGGKSRVAHLVWERFGDPINYVEPFAGSLAVLLGRPTPARIETVNDLDCYVSNFWRALQQKPEEVAFWADHPVNEADLHARHLWLVDRPAFRERMKTDPDYSDAKIAGWWVWGLSCWIGSGWCSQPEWAGRINGGAKVRGTHTATQNNRPKNKATGVTRKLPTLKSSDGVHAPSKQLPDLGGTGSSGRGVHGPTRVPALIEWMQELAGRLRSVRVCCGDWKRVLGRSITECIGTSAILLDPPYASDRDTGIYQHDDFAVSPAVRTWAIENGNNPLLRIALCGYEGEHEMPADWACLAWKSQGGHGNNAKGRGRANSLRERVWFSPYCLRPEQAELFAA